MESFHKIDMFGYYILGLPLFFAVLAFEVRRTKAKGLKPPTFATSIGNLTCGLGQIVVGLLIGPPIYALYDFGVKMGIGQLPANSVLTWIFSLLLVDLCYYCQHRAGHRLAVVWALHGVHHQSEEFNATLAARAPWFTDVFSPFFYFPCALLGVPAPIFFIMLVVLSVNGITMHSHVFDRPSLGIFIVPRVHILHHAINRRYIGKNLGAIFNFWDRLFGTYVPPHPDDPPVLGTPRGYGTHNGALAQFQFFKDIFLNMGKVEGFLPKLKTLFAPPGWSPDGKRHPTDPSPRESSAIPLGMKAYVFFQFLFVSFMVIFAFANQSSLGLPLAFSLSVLGLGTTYALGKILDGVPKALEQERIRVLVVMVAGVWMWTQGRWTSLAAIMMISAAIACVTFYQEFRSANRTTS